MLHYAGNPVKVVDWHQTAIQHIGSTARPVLYLVVGINPSTCWLCLLGQDGRIHQLWQSFQAFDRHGNYLSVGHFGQLGHTTVSA